MKIHNFDDALHYVLMNEGGYSNHPLDHGGATNFGITQDTLSRYRGKPCTAVDVLELQLTEVGEIYKRWYWDILRLDFVKNLQVATALFDVGVNTGNIRAARIAQGILNETVDGLIGEKTLAAINDFEPGVFISLFSMEVKKFYFGIVQRKPDQHVFLKGWTARADKLLTLNEV